MKKDNKNCQRCGMSFVCQPDDIPNCGCSKVELDNSTLEYLSQTHYECLCNKCLIELNLVVEKSRQIKKEKGENVLLENIHFYREGGLMIFTELFHISRGYCCESGCRHCAYGYQKN